MLRPWWESFLSSKDSSLFCCAGAVAPASAGTLLDPRAPVRASVAPFPGPRPHPTIALGRFALCVTNATSRSPSTPWPLCLFRA